MKLIVECEDEGSRDEATDVEWVKSFQGLELIKMSSKAGCPAFSLNELFIFMDKIRIIIGVILLPPGLFLLLKGRQKIHISIFISNFICFTFFFLFLMYFIFLSDNRTVWIDWVNLAAWTLIAGAASGFLTRRFLKYSIFIQAIFAGFVAGILLMTATQIPVAALLYVLMCILGICNVIFLRKKPDLSMMVNSSLIGSYLVVRGLALIIGPDLI